MNFEDWLSQFGLDKNGRFENPLNPVSSKTGKRDKSAVWYSDINIVKCWRSDKAWTPVNFYMAVNGCSFKEAINQINLKFEKKHRVEYHKPKALNTPPGYKNLVADGGGFYREYVKGRGFNPIDLAVKGFGFSEDEKWRSYLIIPMRYKGEICYWQGRAIVNKTPKYLNLTMKDTGYGKADIMYNWDAINEKEVWLTEGWACAETIGGAAYLGGRLSSRQMSDVIQAKCEKVYLCPDLGKEKQAIEDASVLLKYKEVYLVVPESEDINERGGVEGLDVVKLDRLKCLKILSKLK